ncbi:MAG: tRNA (adenosine(37)-N6)-dimethylallyltransferase MiaA [Alphaproteobacteria bacterium]|nr:tRNA (adenosine(37)-N6)-dimethylallyltransferase MiaA [Alphaproteobacteria bacterium]MBM3651345.1 tRNA (adenosine(37)-N6)-dimethylallyltransferase MiaA [Alphaproteobacteria bacterium]
MRARAILIAGPTASGKSALALALARRLGGAIVNADSMQVYRDLRIITARPTVEEESAAPHLLFGHVDAATNYSVGRWLEDFARALRELEARGLTPIVVGGTGMYFKAALSGLSDIPAAPGELRDALRAWARDKTPRELHAELAARDPDTAATLRDTDPQRLLRALEVLEATGRPLVSFHGLRSPPLLNASECAVFFLAPERKALYARIDARFEKMAREGAIEEVTALKARGLDPALPAMRAHGVPHLIAWLDGRLTLEEAILRSQIDTRRYAKRQFTFARHQLPSFNWISGETPLRDVDDALSAGARPTSGTG